MKKISLLVLLFLLLPYQAFAATNVQAGWYYVSYLDQYKLDYQGVINSTNYQLHFTSPTSQVFTGDYPFPPTGTHYLTCNGTYKLKFFDSSGALIGETVNITTSVIKNPTCSSYANGISGKDDLQATTNGNQIKWNSLPAASKYEIWKNGNKVSETAGTDYTVSSTGFYSVVAKDQNGNVVGQSDVKVSDNASGGMPNPDDPDYGDFDPNCATCKELWELLQCPDWDDYMGELTGAIRAALPPPPDWDLIADKVGAATIRHLENYFGPVPPAPTQAEIDSNLNTTLPPVDISSPESESLVPTMPAGYEQPKDFDITTGQQIDVTDNSKPFEIMQPLNNITYDAPGVAVKPSDPRNNTGGIKKPENVNTGSAPKPTNPQSLPNNPVPKPESNPSSAPKPDVTPSNKPIPVWKGD